MQRMKRFLSIVVTVCMIVSILATGVLAITITDRPANGTTTGQPFAPGTGGSQNFRIPGIVTLDNGTLIAACDARWNHAGDGAGLDTIVSVSEDNGENWTYTFANYLGDNGNVYNNLSTCIIDPGIGTDGETAYLIADLWPAGIALNTSRYSPVAGENGFDDNGNLLLRALADDTVAIGSNGYNTMAAVVSRYTYYLDLESLTLHNADGTPIEGYTVDAYFNITGNGVDTNLFFSDSPYQPYPTDYLYMTTSTDGLNWSVPTLLNLKEEAEQTLLVGPGNGTYDEVNDRMIFTAYEHTSGYERTSLIWMDSEGNWYRSEDATNNSSNKSSEATAVVLDDGTVRVFFRDYTNYLQYSDYVWSDEAQNYVVSAREVATTAPKRQNNQLTSILYSERIDGKEVILVACAANPNERRDGHLYVFLVNEDNSMELAYDYDIIPDQNEVYAYNCITELNDGNIGLLYESNGSEITYLVIDMDDVLNRDNDPRLTIKEVELLAGHSATFADNSGCYVGADISELDTNVATLTMTGEEVTTNAARVLSSGANIDLDSCQYTFTAIDGGYYEISATAADGTTVYLNHFSSGNNNPSIASPAGKIAVLQGTVDGMFRLQAQVVEGGTGNARTLHFHAENATAPYWNRCGSDTSYKCHEYLYRKAAEGETASTEIPGYVRLTSVDQLVDGGQYLIAAKNDAGNWYVLNPASTTTTLDHVAQIMGSTTVGHTELTFTGVGTGYTEVVVGSTLYKISVHDVAEVELEIALGESVTVREPNGNNADADTSGLDTSVATVSMVGYDGTADNGLSLAPVTALTNGKYVILNTRANKLVTNDPVSASAAAGAGSGLKLNGSIQEDVAANAVWTITGSNGSYTIQDLNGKYMTVSSNNASVADASATLTLNYGGSTWTIAQNGAYLNHFGGGSSICAAGWQDASAAGDSGSQFDIYSYSEEPVTSGTEITFTGVGAGSTELLVGRTRYLITVTGSVVDVDLKVGESQSFLVDGDPDIITVPDENVALAEFHAAEIGHLGTDASYNGAFVDLTDALFTFTANEDGTYVISNGENYLEGYATNNGHPVVDFPTNVTIGDGFSDYSVTLYSTSVGAERSGYLFFWRDGKNYYDRVTSTGGFESGVSFHLYEQLEDGSFAMIAGKDEIVSGGRYLIVADAGEHGLFVTWPTTDRTTRYSQIAKFGTGTRITLTGVGAGETVLAISGTIYEIVVTAAAHEHSYEAVVTAPTCTEGGYTTYTCECGDSYTADETAALGHDWQGVACSRCDATRENPFEDVPNDSFYIDPVLWAVEHGYTTGVDATHFAPAMACNRGQVVTFLWRAAGSPEPTTTENPFNDVQEGAFYYKAVLWAVENGITTGMGEGSGYFAPEVNCNRAQVVTFLWRAMGKPAPTTTENPFSDVAEGAFYYDAMLWAVENGITTGMGETGTFAPELVCNRAQVVTFLYRAYAE